LFSSCKILINFDDNSSKSLSDEYPNLRKKFPRYIGFNVEISLSKEVNNSDVESNPTPLFIVSLVTPNCLISQSLSLAALSCFSVASILASA